MAKTLLVLKFYQQIDGSTQPKNLTENISPSSLLRRREFWSNNFKFITVLLFKWLESDFNSNIERKYQSGKKFPL